jgi:hypothetical protein
VAGSCEHGNEVSGSIKCDEFLDYTVMTSCISCEETLSICKGLKNKPEWPISNIIPAVLSNIHTDHTVRKCKKNSFI